MAHHPWLWIEISAIYEYPPPAIDIGHAPQRPSAPSDTVFVNDLGKGKTLTCLPHSKGPLDFDIDIARYLVPTQGNGRISGVADLVSKGVISDSATLRMAVYTAKLPSAAGPGAAEADIVTVNGDSLMWDDKNTGVINKTTAQWAVYDMKMPISQLLFPPAPADASAGSGPAPVHNRVSINVDGANSTDTYCLAVDWAQISFGAQAPLMLIHGTNAQHTTWEFHIPGHQSPVDYITSAIGVDFEYKIDLEPNGSIEGNAALLRQALLRETRRRGVQNVHLVTHSKGATDSRYFLSMIYDPAEFKVLSLYSLASLQAGMISAIYRAAGSYARYLSWSAHARILEGVLVAGVLACGGRFIAIAMAMVGARILGTIVLYENGRRLLPEVHCKLFSGTSRGQCLDQSRNGSSSKSSGRAGSGGFAQRLSPARPCLSARNQHDFNGISA